MRLLSPTRRLPPNPMVHAARTRLHHTSVILDEFTHAGDASWGDGVREALASHAPPCVDRFSLSALTLLCHSFCALRRRRIKRSRADFTYGYGDALRDFVVQPVLFMSYSGRMSWRTAGKIISTPARLGEPLADLHETGVANRFGSQGMDERRSPSG